MLNLFLARIIPDAGILVVQVNKTILYRAYFSLLSAIHKVQKKQTEMKHIKFRSPGQFLVFIAFFLLSLLCLIGSWSNPFHILNAGLCGFMAWGTYNSW